MSTITAIHAAIAFVGLIMGGYLSYQILVHIKATEFMWFYFAAFYVIATIAAIIGVAARKKEIQDEVEKAVNKRLERMGKVGGF